MLATVERRLILEALATESGDLAAAARRLGISRPGLYQRLERLGLEPPHEPKLQVEAEKLDGCYVAPLPPTLVQSDQVGFSGPLAPT